MASFRRYLITLLATILMMAAAIPHVAARPGEKPVNRPYADQRRWHLGFSVGIHTQDLSFTHNGYVASDGARWVAEVPEFSPGFCVNVLADIRLHKYASLRFSPGMYFGSKGITMLNHFDGTKTTQDVKSALLALPLDLKVNGDRLRNVRPYLTLGAMMTSDLGKKRHETLMFNTSDAFLTVGLGLDLYLPFFNLSPELKFCFGLTDILRHSRPDLEDAPDLMNMTNSLKKVKQNIVVLSFYFE